MNTYEAKAVHQIAHRRVATGYYTEFHQLLGFLKHFTHDALEHAASIWKQHFPDSCPLDGGDFHGGSVGGY
jgi:hypothetical protein